MQVKTIISSVVVCIALSTVTSLYAGPLVYMELTSDQSQTTTMDNLNQPVVIALNPPDEISGLSVDLKSNEVVVHEDGVYFMVATVQMGVRESASDIVKGGDVYFWFERNKVPILNSTNWIFVKPSSRSNTITNQLAVSFKAGDRITLKFTSSTPSVGLISFPATERWPAAPGLSFTMYKLGEIPSAKPALTK